MHALLSYSYSPLNTDVRRQVWRPILANPIYRVPASVRYGRTSVSRVLTEGITRTL